MKFDQKTIGYLLIVFSIFLIILLSLVKADLDQRDAFLCEAVHSNPNLEMSQCPVHQSGTSWYLTAAFGVAFLILGSGIYLGFFPNLNINKKEKESFKEVDKSQLDEEEIKIYSTLKQNKGSMYQSDLIKDTDFSKVKMTRILDKMENKDIIERKRRGMTNIIVLKWN